MKWLILLIILFVLAAIIATRYRRQINTAIYIWKMFGKMRQAGKAQGKQIEKKENAKDVALVRCAKCGTWIPQTNALTLRSGVNYCSTVCLETAAKVV